jgi:hypothetical protein
METKSTLRLLAGIGSRHRHLHARQIGASHLDSVRSWAGAQFEYATRDEEPTLSLGFLATCWGRLAV